MVADVVLLLVAVVVLASARGETSRVTGVFCHRKVDEALTTFALQTRTLRTMPSAEPACTPMGAAVSPIMLADGACLNLLGPMTNVQAVGPGCRAREH